MSVSFFIKKYNIYLLWGFSISDAPICLYATAKPDSRFLLSTFSSILHFHIFCLAGWTFLTFAAQICVPATYLKCWKLFIIKSWRPKVFAVHIGPGRDKSAFGEHCRGHSRFADGSAAFCPMRRIEFLIKIPRDWPSGRSVSRTGMIVIYAMAIIIHIFKLLARDTHMSLCRNWIYGFPFTIWECRIRESDRVNLSKCRIFSIFKWFLKLWHSHPQLPSGAMSCI